MNTPLQFHSIHGEHIKLSRNNTIAKRVDSFCKGICFSNRTIQIRERVYVRLLSKSIQWTGFLRLGVTTSDPSTHRVSTSLPRHACPDLTCRPGYWAKCVPENCFDLTNKLTYFYVDENGELFLNTPTGEISLLTGIFVQEPLWALLDIYGNCISIELAEDQQKRSVSVNDQLRNLNPIVTSPIFKDICNDLTPLPFLPVHSSSISFFSSSSNSLPNQSIVLFDNRTNCDGLVFFSEPLVINSGLLVQILSIIPSNESQRRTTTTTTSSNLLPSHIQFGLTNCNTQSLLRSNDLPLDIEKINNRSEFWIVQDFKFGTKTTIDREDEFLFTFKQDGVIEYSHNNSKLKDFIHVDSTLTYYPFLILKGDIVAVRSMGFIKNLDRYRSLQQINNAIQTNHACTAANNNNNNNITNNNGNNESDFKLNQDCTVCFDHLRDTVLIPCGHICLCYTCATELVEHGSKQCPICRTSIQLINKIYLA
ncbi:unnamed protein product [Rotaria socialis]|uniref:Uncharacterized protein n=1 Tax=Rotaria socialis TaxID=392032 RepID=A0A818G9L7_9BILA|nr:unnamed protein product [Rotaria socialis]CAF3338769.1 unnamed protein product [Rotaria socialis]CAF3488212.1 unnamed protein product [Rotaria socialis]CAF3616349.1 unnamed protein product [Rotaria socialis]CAF4454850.1 unnamed protein product [Rotaria socialis]